MPRITIYECDRCGHTQDRDRKFSDDQRWMRTITVYVEDGFNETRTNLDTEDRPVLIPFRDNMGSVLWCEKCCDDTGISKLTAVSRRPINDGQPVATLETAIRDVVDRVLSARGIG